MEYEDEQFKREHRPPIFRASDSDIILFSFPSSGQRGSRNFYINKGRIYESYNHIVKKPWNNLSLHLKNINSKEDLMAFTEHKQKEEALAYLTTDDGIKEISAILNFIESNK